MSINFTIADVQRIIESYDEGVFETAYLIVDKAPPSEALKTLFDQAKQAQIEALLIMNNIDNMPNPEGADLVDQINIAIAQECLPPIIQNTTKACDKIADRYPQFLLR